MFSKSLLILAAAAVAVNAQSSSPAAPTASPGLVSSCVLGCVGPAAVLNNCTSPVDLPCVCQSAQFQADAGACLMEHCPTELQNAIALQSAGCTGYTVVVTATPTPRTGIFTSLPTQTGTVPAPSVSVSPKPTATGSGSAASQPTSSASTGTNLQVGVGAFFAAVFAAVFAL